jgi:hypothetical protein
VGFLRRLLGGTPQPEKSTLEFVIEPVEREEREPYADLGDRRGDLPPEGLGLMSGPGLDVTGESNYRATIAEVTGGRQKQGVRGTFWAALIPERDNPYDSNAVSVRIDGRTVGYLPRADAKRYRPVLDRIVQAGRVAYVRADIRGGWNRSARDTGDYGITLYAGGPERQSEMIDHVLEGKSRAEIASARPAMKPGRKQGPGTYRGRDHWEWHPEVDRLRAMGSDTEAEELLLAIVDATEEEAAHEGNGVAPGSYETLAVMYRKRKDREGEIAILERFAAQPHAPGAVPPKLLERLAKLKAKSN